MEFLDSLLRHPHTVRADKRSTAPAQTRSQIVRNTGTIPSQRHTETVSTHRVTGALNTKQRTGAVSTTRVTSANATEAYTSKRASGAIPTTRTTGMQTARTTSITTSKRIATSIPEDHNSDTRERKRATGTHTPGRTGEITTRRPPTARYSIEEDDIYRGNSESSIIYTAGTNLFWVILIAIIIWLIVSMAQAAPNQSIVSSYSQRTNLRAVAQIIGIQLPEPTIAPVSIVIPPGESSILGAPTITAAQIDAILQKNNSPATGTGAIWIEAGIQYGIDPVYGLAFFMHESGYGTNPQWAGLKPDGTTTHNVGNIICANYPTCFGRFRDYPDWQTGIYDWYRLIAVEYIQWRGLATVEGILPVYAPSFENDVPRYINTIKYAVAEWRQMSLSQTP